VTSLLVGEADGLTGIAPASEILSVPVMSGDGSGSTFALARGIVEAVDRGADVLNICISSFGDCIALREAVAYALARDVAVVAAAGNDAVSGVSYPARYDGVVAVAAVDASGRHLYFSNRGPEVDVAAPGYRVSSAWSDDNLILFTGTSAATPLVSGTLAALLAAEPGRRAEEAVEMLLRYTDDAGAPGKDEEYGQGILNLGRIEDSNTRGIRDVAVGELYVPSPQGEEEGVRAAVYAENRGTEALRQVDLVLEVDGDTRVFSFYDVEVGQTVSEEFLIDPSRVEGPDGAVITYSARIPGAEDVNPMNNAGRSVVSIRQEAGEEAAAP
jgi:hypothetical protein